MNLGLVINLHTCAFKGLGLRCGIDYHPEIVRNALLYVLGITA